MTAEILYIGGVERARPGGREMRSDDWEVEAINPLGGEVGGDEGWDGEAWSEGLGAIRRRDSSSCASEEENGRAPVSEGVVCP